ncbi:MAG TPA: transposase, partial [Sphingomicrobium sp.]
MPRPWCLMPNHVHLVLRPPTATALRALTSSVHTRYAQRINRREQSSGHLFQDRYRSYPIDDAHLMVAVRCVASARAHLSLGTDPLTVVG